MNPLDFFFQFAAAFVAAIIALTLGRALAARIAGPHAGLVLSGPIIAINIALPHRREVEEDQEVPRETGNTETLETAGNNGETDGETLGLMSMNNLGDKYLAPRLSREEYHELVEARVQAIDLLDHCVRYYEESQATDTGIIPRYNKIGMKSKRRQDAVDNLWYSQVVIKSPNETMVDPAYYPSCFALREAIKDKRVRVNPMGWIERRQQKHLEAAMALPERERDE